MCDQRRWLTMKAELALVVLLCVGCTPAEIAIAEELTEEAILVEKDIFDPPSPLVKENQETSYKVGKP